MGGTSQFTIGAHVACTDGEAGEIRRVVIDPVARALTQLVVRPKHGRILDRLVPLDLVVAADGEVRLRCTLEEFDKLDAAEEVQFLQGPGGFGYTPMQALWLPYFAWTRSKAAVTTWETVPLGEVDVRRGDKVRARDGEIGHIEGLVVDPADDHVTHVLLQEGHLWGRRQVAIPISVVTKVDAASGVSVSLTKQEVHDLSPIDLDVPNS